MNHQYWMHRALFLSYYYKGTTSPNPTVGAILLNKQGEYLGSSVTLPAGGFHAERRLLHAFSVDQTQGGTLYVTLEPCCFYGRTPACTDIIIEKKIAHVVIATEDKNSKVLGQGIKILKEAGIKVTTSILEKEAIAINQDFFYAIQHKRPFVFAKVASSLDGCLATSNGDSQWISSSSSRTLSHILRYRSDAILVGANTAINDNPSLNARLGKIQKSLYRIICDPNAKILENLKVFQDDNPTLWVVDVKLKKDSNFIIKQNKYLRSNKEIFFLDYAKGFLPLLEFLYQEKQIISLMVEGGSFILGEFIKQNLLQSVFIFYGNMFLGNGLKIFPISIEKVSQAPILKNTNVKIKQGQLIVYGNL